MVTIRITPSKEIPEEQVNEIKEIFISEGLSTEIFSRFERKSFEELPPVIIIIISGIAGGILGAIGKDIWGALKRAVVKAYSYLQNKRKQNPQIKLSFEDERSNIIINLPDEDTDEIEEAITKLQKYLNDNPIKSGWIWFDKDSHEWKKWT